MDGSSTKVQALIQDVEGQNILNIAALASVHS